jgi:16S rRNA (cytidine1402-2'-O)-methyltransferase
MLSFIPTPIGNKEDITLRALRLLRELPVLFCEDIWTTRRLLSMYEISASDKKLYSLTSHTSTNSVNFYVELMSEQNCGVVSEAWTPWLSDPGKHLIKLCREQNIPFEVLPWANALVPVVVATPFDTSVRLYYGFLPQKKWRQTVLKEILQSVYPVYIYESVHRIEKLMKELTLLEYSWTVLIARELSKLFEQYFHGSVDEVQEAIKNKKIPLKGEFVVCFIPKND